MTRADDAPTKATRLALGLGGAFALGLASYWLVRAAVVFATPESVWVAPLPARQASVAQPPVRTLDTGFDPFHRAVPVAFGPAEIGEDAPETTLNVALMGLRAGPDGSAFIRPPSGKVGVFYVGDEVVPGVSVEAVNPGFVVLDRNGALERLSIDRESVMSVPEIDPVPAILPIPGRGPGRADTSPESAPPPVTSRRIDPRTASNTPKAPRLNRITAGDLMRDISLSPVREDGRMQGFRVSSRGATDLSDYGLRGGDVLTGVNGRDLTQGRPDIAGLTRELQQTNTATLQIIRNGNPITIRVGTP